MRVRMKIRNQQVLVGTTAIVLGLIGTGFGLYTQHHEDSSISCQAAINKEFLAVIKERSVVTNDNTGNVNTLILEVFTPGVTQQQIAADYKTYLTELAIINGDLKQDTYPSIGSC